MSILLLYVTFLALGSPMFGEINQAGQKEPVKIGLLIQDRSHTEIIQAAELAIAEANKIGGYQGQAFELVIRTTEGPWGAGSKESVNLVYEDNVRAIVGSLDGRNGHLAEQVAARSNITYLETRASDPTLSQAYVPWFFRIVPNDDQQSKAILDLIKEKGGGKIAILSSDQYDARYAVKSLTKIYARETGEGPLVLTIEPEKSSTAALTDQITNATTDHLIVPFFSDASIEIVELIKRKLPGIQIYGTLAFTIGLDNHSNDWKAFEGMILVNSYEESLESSHNQISGISSSFTYDGMNLVIEAIRQAGLERGSIKETLLRMKYPQGVTGPVSFDDMGNRTGNIRFIQILHGNTVQVN